MSFDPQKALRQQREAEISKSWFLTKLHEFNQAHNRVKNTVHTAWRYPLPPWGRAMMGFVYFSIPVIAGYYLGNWAYSKSESTLEERFGKESEANKITGLGDKRIIRDKESGEQRLVRVGAGGWGGGVHLVTSDQETQDVNKINLERFLKKQRRMLEKKERRRRQEQQQIKEKEEKP